MKKIFALLVLAGSLARAETVVVGQLIYDGGYYFNSFGNQYNAYVGGTTRGANFSGGSSVTWNTTLLSNVNGANGISWTGSYVNAVGHVGEYGYTDSLYPGLAGTSVAANDLTNTGIASIASPPSTPTITISSIVGSRYVIDLLFANAFNARTFDIKVGGSLYLDDLVLDLSRRPLVYRFEYVATGSTIPITFAAGTAAGISDTNPYVNAISVTQVPEPGSGALLMIGGVVLAVMRRRRA